MACFAKFTWSEFENVLHVSFGTILMLQLFISLAHLCVFNT